MIYTYVEILNDKMSYVKHRNSLKRCIEGILFVYVGFGGLYLVYFSLTENIPPSPHEGMYRAQEYIFIHS
jgi:hypothetical protein